MADEYIKIALEGDERLLVDAATASSWGSFEFLEQIFTSSGNVGLRRFDDGVSGKRLSRLITDGVVTIEVHRFAGTDPSETRMGIFRKGNESINHSRLKLSTALWLIDRFKPTQKILLEPTMSHGRPDLFMPEHGGVWVECGDTESYKILKALISGYSCLLVPFVCCDPLGGIMLHIKKDELARVRKDDMGPWEDGMPDID